MKESRWLLLFTNVRFQLCLGIFIITLCFMPYLIEGENIYVPVFDNLDSNVVWAKMVLDQGGILLPPGQIVYQIMNGLPHASVYGTYDICLIWFQLLGMFWGYVINKYLIALIGFLGMYYLLKKYFLSPNCPSYIVLGVSVFYGLLPFWSFSASVSGIPMTILVFLNIRQGEKNWYNWAILLLYAFYSSLITAGFFVLLLMFILFVIDWIKKKKFNIPFFLSMAFLSTMYILSHLPLFYSFFFSSDFVSHRTEFHSYEEPIRNILRNIQYIFINGDTYGHAVSLHKYMILPIIFVLAIMMKDRKINRLYISVFVFVILTSIFYGLYDWYRLTPLLQKIVQVIPMDFRRFFWLHPVCWAILFFMAMCHIYNRFKWGRYVAYVILLFQLVYVVSEQPYMDNKDNSSYKSFYAEQQFNDIKSYIGKEPSTYRVINIRLHPAISQYNGFYTLDGFSANYPLSYKHQFRKIIEKVLVEEKNIFDWWGSQCYAYTNEGGAGSRVLYYVNDVPKVNHLDYNYDVLKEMGGEYILSAIEINEDNNPRLQLLKVFDNYADSQWDIYLYKVN
ncbi:DUF6044 family protein [Prevotella sp. 10(H)]|uniref:DUF6044 family protein n=1 Tax=Prevotella sp. 10(H) TaxID=1158294 RepID=UPI0004A6DB16|nr:DUF6044 family protein [Prevotella sp. 10(H)]